jgi:hypothetical protein
MRVQSKEKYERVDLSQNSYPRYRVTATINVQYPGRKEKFVVTSDNPNVYIPQFGRAFLELQDPESRVDDFIYFRDARDSTVPPTDLNKWFMTRRDDSNICSSFGLEYTCKIGITPTMYTIKFGKVGCFSENLATTNDPAHMKDQFYIYRNNTAAKMFAGNPALLSFNVVKGDSGDYVMQFEQPPKATITVTLTNLT